MVIVVLSAIALVLIANLRVALVRRRKVRPTRATAVSALQTEDIELPPGGLQSMLGGQLSSLAIGAPRNAIVAAWVQLEDFATSHGLAKDPADTPAEFVARALATYDLDLGSIQRLADLYREARFSRHEIDERHRDEARACIERLTGRVVTP